MLFINKTLNDCLAAKKKMKERKPNSKTLKINDFDYV